MHPFKGRNIAVKPLNERLVGLGYLRVAIALLDERHRPR
jgi:hypothetical protein